MEENNKIEVEEVELREHWAVIRLPENTCEVNIKVKVFHEGELITVEKTLTFNDVRTAFKKANDGYIDEDDRFVITEEGQAYLEELRKLHSDELEAICS